MVGSTFLAMSGSAQILALVIVFFVHVLGAACLVWALLGDRGWGGMRDWWQSDDGPQGPPQPPAPDPRPSGPGLPLPLPDAFPSEVRLREPARLAESHPRPPRRPEHPPEPARRPERAE